MVARALPVDRISLGVDPDPVLVAQLDVGVFAARRPAAALLDSHPGDAVVVDVFRRPVLGLCLLPALLLGVSRQIGRLRRSTVRVEVLGQLRLNRRQPLSSRIGLLPGASALEQLPGCPADQQTADDLAGCPARMVGPVIPGDELFAEVDGMGDVVPRRRGDLGQPFVVRVTRVADGEDKIPCPFAKALECVPGALKTSGATPIT